jgi:hypothetical protein
MASFSSNHSPVDIFLWEVGGREKGNVLGTEAKKTQKPKIRARTPNPSSAAPRRVAQYV